MSVRSNKGSTVVLTEDKVEEIRRREFPATEAASHLKASGGSPMCQSAYDAQASYLRQMCFEGDLYYSGYLTDLDHARARIAAVIGALPSEIGFTVNSSSAATIAVEMLGAAGVTRVYYPVSEFPTSVHALANSPLELVPVGDAHLRDAAADWLEAVERHLSEHPTRDKCALIASHVCYLNGVTLDIAAAAAFCKAREMLLVLNATQSFGALSMDVSDGVDMLFATGLKWAFAGYGAGFLYIRQSLVDGVGLPRGTGWLSVTNPYRMDNGNTAAALQARSLDAGGGMPHFGPLLGLNGALSMFEAIGEGDIRAGICAVERRLIASAAYLKQALLDGGMDVLGPPNTPQSSGIVTIIADNAKSIATELAANKIFVSLRTAPMTDAMGAVRFGIHFFNTKKELDSALSMLL